MKNKKLKILSYFGLVCITASCSFFRYMNTSSPTNEKLDDIEKYFNQNQIDFYDYSFLLIDSLIDSLSTPKHAINTWKLERGTTESVIQLKVYDSTGQLINGYSQCFGEFSKLNILKKKDLVYFNYLPINYNLKLEDEFKLIEISEQEIDDIQKTNRNSKYTMVVYWNIWSNYYSKVIFKELKRYLKEYESEDFPVMVIIVNTGFTPTEN